MYRRNIFIIVLTIFWLSILSACVVVPERAQLIRNGDKQQHSPECGMSVSVQSSTTATLTGGFTLISWNIHKGSETGWKKELRDITTDTDLLLLQEARLNGEMLNLLGSWSNHWVMGPAFSLQGVHNGVLTAARFGDATSCSTLVNEPLIGVPKALLINYYPISGQTHPMLVANIHGVNFTVGTQQLAQQLRFIAEAVAEHSGPAIVAGDFNTWSRERMDLLLSMTASAGLQAVGFDGHKRSLHLGKPVDHIYYKGLKLVDSQVLVMHSSDHQPLKARFELE